MSTVDAYWRTLQSLFSWLVREEVIDEKNNPLKKIPRPKVLKKLIDAIPLEMIKKALDLWSPDTLIGARNRAIIMILLDTGIRLLEISKLIRAPRRRFALATMYPCSTSISAPSPCIPFICKSTGLGPQGGVVRIYEVGGRLVHEERLPAGARSGTIVWGGEDLAGRMTAAGTYFAVVQSAGATRTTRFLRIR